jgi:hypothetical protein
MKRTYLSVLLAFINMLASYSLVASSNTDKLLVCLHGLDLEYKGEPRMGSPIAGIKSEDFDLATKPEG